MAADWVIVVDDDRNDQRMACEMLHRAGIRTTAMRSGTAALDYIRKGGIPDLILLDVNMPETDGFETLRMLREQMDPAPLRAGTTMLHSKAILSLKSLPAPHWATRPSTPVGSLNIST